MGEHFSFLAFFDQLHVAFALYVIFGLEWNEPAATKDTEKTLNLLREIAGAE